MAAKSCWGARNQNFPRSMPLGCGAACRLVAPRSRSSFKEGFLDWGGNTLIWGQDILRWYCWAAARRGA